MRRLRKDATKVWHNPDINTFAKRSGRGSAEGSSSREPAPSDDPRSKQGRAAFEALFASKKESDAPEPVRKPAPSSKGGGRIVPPPAQNADPKAAERQKLLTKFLNAEGRPNVSKAADDFLRAGFVFPVEQDVYLKLLEHANEDHVRDAIDKLGEILAGEPPQRRAMLDSRLRRIEQFAEEPATRAAAEKLRRRVSGRGDGAPSAPDVG